MMSIATTLPVISLKRAAARSALAHIDDLQPVGPEYLGEQDCILIALRGRLRDRRREVPTALWPELERWLAESPGVVSPVIPSRRYAGEQALRLASALMAWHVTALFTEGVEPFWVLIAEGLLNALIAEPQTVAGEDLLAFVDSVLAEFGDDA